MSAPSTGSPLAQIANPASKNCAEEGGRLTIEKNAAGSEYGVCIFDVDHQCEEWALFRKECPVGGVNIVGYVTDAAKYCGIRGGKYEITAHETKIQPEQGTCTLPDKQVCDAHLLYSGKCTK